jgi:O-glycosyl hydrolase
VFRFDGWGTSLCWFGNAVGRWSEPQRSEIADLLFSPGGLGLTVVRYNIGGGEAPGHRHMLAFRQMDGFQSASGEWNWNADPGQRWFLQAAIQRGANILEAFSNSPPYWMTVSQCASGSADGNADNLDPRFQTAFVDYLVEVTKHFRDNWGVSFQTLDPFNEPYTDYWKLNGRQEGCHFDRSSQSALIKLLRTRLDARGLRATRISAADETNFDRTIGTFDAYDRETLACVAQINTHAYATERRTELRQLAQRLGKVLVMSEVDGAGGAGHDHDAMAPALELADRIIGDLKELRPAQWVFWQAVEDKASQAAANKNWGLIHADLQGQAQTYTLTKKYYAMAGFTKYIRPGQVIVPVDDGNSIAAFDARSGTLILVTRNATAADVSVTYDLSAFTAMAGSAVPHRTSATENLAQLPPVEISAKGFTAPAKAQSLTTYELKGVAYPTKTGSDQEIR